MVGNQRGEKYPEDASGETEEELLQTGEVLGLRVLSVNMNVSVGIQGFSATYKNHWRTLTLQPPLFHFLLVI